MSNNNQHRRVEFISFVFVTVVLFIGFYSLYKKRTACFDKMDKNTIALTIPDSKSRIDKTQQLTDLLFTGNYVETLQDANYISQHIFGILEEKASFENLNLFQKSKKWLSGISMDNLGSLNKRDFAIVADSVDKVEFPELQMRVINSRQSLQFPDSLQDLEYLYQTETKKSISLAKGNRKFSIVIKDVDKNPIPNTLVKLTEYFELSVDSLESNEEANIVDSVYYCQTDDEGRVIFDGLNGEGYYSVIPLKKGFEYGSPRGTSDGNLDKTLGSFSFKFKRFFRGSDFEFTEKTHKIKPFGTLTYQQLKIDEVLTVRTAKEYNTEYWKYIILFFAAWWLLWLMLNFTHSRKFDLLLLPLLMTLSGICVLMMYAIHEPLTDTMRGNIMMQGVLLGIFSIWLLSKINFVNLFEKKQKLFSLIYIGKDDNKRFVIKRKDFSYFFFEGNLCSFPYIGHDKNGNWIVKRRTISLPRYSIYLIIGLILTLLLFPFGTGPEGSGVKVNLWFFQPSEIVKYLLLLFFAAFFYKNADYYKDKKYKLPFGIRMKRTLPIFLGLGFMLLLYLVLGDMGPALTLAIAFILIYSVVRGDFKQLLLGTSIFVLLFLLINSMKNEDVNKGIDVTAIFAIVAVLWLIIWVFYGRKSKYKTVFESAIFMNLVIAAFIFGSSIPHVGERLQDRIDIAGNGVWNNEVQGGDQVAQGLWGLASGGLPGQGFENGSPNVIPAFHTDMVLASVGEILGWTGLALIIICLGILIHRSILIGRRAAHPFAFFLAFGIAIITTVQFLIIAFGSIGIIPLTGIAVPFVSYGRVSMIFNLAAFGVVLSLSQLEGKKIEKDNTQDYDSKSTRPAILTIFGVTILLLCILFKYQFIQRNDILIKPAFVTNRSGERIAEYNPRINILIRNMNAGNIYDRNGLLLATNDKNEMLNNLKDELKETDHDLFKTLEGNINREARQLGKRRFYPYGDNMFFWTGNYNTRLLWDDGEDARGYIAERRHLAFLRGFNTQPKEDAPADTLLNTHNFVVSRFLPKQEYDSIKCKLYDYTELISFLKQGKNSSKLKSYNEKRKDRDIKLTVDAKLQIELQNALTKANLGKNMRTSVVVLDAKNGELLSSASYPLPDQTDLKIKYDDKNYKDYRDYATANRDLGLTWATNPGSTAKLISSLAWFRKQENTHSKEPIKTYNIDVTEILDFNDRTGRPAEPYNQRNGIPLRQSEGNMGKTHQITMQEAIELSSNVYFIKLVNDNNLYSQLSDIYSAAGLRLGYRYNSYTFYNDRNFSLKKKMGEIENDGIKKYRTYINKILHGGSPRKLQDSEYMIAWGEDPLEATPLAMARIVSAIINNGKLLDTKYVLTEDVLKSLPKQDSIQIISSDNAIVLQDYMKDESQKRTQKLPQFVGGKSGTPTRIVPDLGRRNDGWYVFFIEPIEQNKKTLAVAVRIELGSSSEKAYQVVSNQLIGILTSYAND